MTFEPREFRPAPWAVGPHRQTLAARVLRADGVCVSVVCPGFVTTRMTAGNRFPMPFLMDTPKAARLIANAIARKRRTFVFPWQMRLAVPLLRLLPERFVPMHAVEK